MKTDTLDIRYSRFSSKYDVWYMIVLKTRNNMTKKYCNIDEELETHLLKIIDLLYTECISAGGDGDALWYSRFYDVKDLLLLVEKYNSSLKFPFKIIKDSNDTINCIISEGTIRWENDQECIIITNDESLYVNWPKWGQFVLKN